jgi:electron transport complex protein RnfB
MEEQKNKNGSRREFVRKAGRIAMVVPVFGIPAILASKTKVKGYVWQIDPYKCTSCELCKSSCVMTPSAVKCTNAFPMCGYCDFCPGFLRAGAKVYDTSAENQLCPVGAIKRKFVEEPYFEYTIDEKLCDGCSKCVKACYDFGNGSLYLQIMHNLCVNCNQCAIARVCPSDAVIRVPAEEPYIRKDLKRTIS